MNETRKLTLYEKLVKSILLTNFSCFLSKTELCFVAPITTMEGGGGTLSEIHQTHDRFERLERLEYSNSSSSSSNLFFSVSKDITQIQSLCVEMNNSRDQLVPNLNAISGNSLMNRSLFQLLCLYNCIDYLS